MTAQTAHIEIDLRLDEEGIRGEACRDAGPPQPFSGWLGLISAIDGLLDPAATSRLEEERNS